jgi:hypothetical protein
LALVRRHAGTAPRAQPQAHRSTGQHQPRPRLLKSYEGPVLGTVPSSRLGLGQAPALNAKCRAGFQVAMNAPGASISTFVRRRESRPSPNRPVRQKKRRLQSARGQALHVRRDIPGQPVLAEVSGTGLACRWSPVRRVPHRPKSSFSHLGPARLHQLIANGHFFVTALSRGPILLCSLCACHCFGVLCLS